MLKFFKEHQPVGITGIVVHTVTWLLSDGKGGAEQNPKFVQQWGVHPVGVFCVHGTADRPDAFKKISEALCEKELPSAIDYVRRVAFEGRFMGHSISDFAKELLHQIIMKGYRRVILMGHSRGGLVCAWLAENLAREHGIEVLQVISIGTPFGGSHLAMAPLSWYSASIEEMQADSEFLQALNERIKASSTTYSSYVAESDWIVLEGASHIEGRPESHAVAMSRHGHISIMTSEKIAELIKAELEALLPPGAPEDEQGLYAKPLPDRGLPSP
ncbi:putative lipase [Legionella geestiana]|uniref:Putative lipase n=1 Tax=Legionella geestiana TaxID=45065 RepID=A0A0W0U7Q6_9GAMM|nr:alpha/beta hydrolase [Legionella geestiana]KTD03787.1 putative lipase [Legionella geestiana]QBS11927.1 alpha/beta hydrolase [Legionella geestiana]QDQ40460.1 alpha/beta hydrolase [Legionella geestiana]STX53360.1 putative lipase [Legionella geestiana]